MFAIIEMTDGQCVADMSRGTFMTFTRSMLWLSATFTMLGHMVEVGIIGYHASRAYGETGLFGIGKAALSPNIREGPTSRLRRLCTGRSAKAHDRS